MAAGMGRRFGGLKQLAAVGPSGQALMDYSLHDALAAGFDRVVLVVRSEVEAEMAAHLARFWPSSVPVVVVCQDRGPGMADADGPTAELLRARSKPPGTAHAILAARPHVAGPFAVVNADDLYGPEAFATLASHLKAPPPTRSHALVGFRLDHSIVGDGPVKRGVCRTDSFGYLLAISERDVEVRDDGRYRTSWDSSEEVVDGSTLVSMNMWAFGPSLFEHLESGFERFVSSGLAATDAEFLLPDVVAGIVADDAGAVVVLPTDARCLGITNREDLDKVRGEIDALVADGRYPEPLWPSR